MSERKLEKGLNRRDFIKGAAVGAGAVALSGLGIGAAKAASLPEKWDYETDVLVVGFGGAGGIAAIEAHDHGAKVLIVEKQPENAHISNTRMSGGGFHSADPTGDRAALVQYLKGMMSGENLPWKLEGEQPHVSDEMAKVFAEYLVQNADYMESLDPDFKCKMSRGASFPMFPGAKDCKYGGAKGGYPNADQSVPSYRLPKDQKGNGEAFHYCMLNGIQNRAIPILYSTPAKRLVMKNGEMIGVIAERGGKEIACKARKAVILTTGGYEYSVAQRRAFLKGPGVKGWAFYGSPDNTGDGIEMAMQVKAGLAKVAKSASRVITAVPYGRGYDETGLKMGLITPVASSPNSIVVDNFGKRYWNEHDITNGAAPFRYQFYEVAVRYDMRKMCYTRVPSWLIFDETMRARDCITRLRISTAGYEFVPWTADNLDAIKRGWIFKADTIAEVAAMIKADSENRNMMDVATLAETVNNFKNYCTAGKDPDFERTPATMAPVETPPFYALRLYPGGPNSKGGIDADAQRRVLDWEGKPMPRFYTAGEISSVWKFTYQGRGNVAECIVCGRIAGKNAAAEKSRE